MKKNILTPIALSAVFLLFLSGCAHSAAANLEGAFSESIADRAAFQSEDTTAETSENTAKVDDEIVNKLWAELKINEKKKNAFIYILCSSFGCFNVSCGLCT